MPKVKVRTRKSAWVFLTLKNILDPGNPLSNEREGKIVGGEESIPHSHPFIISLQRSSHSCGGTIVNENFIITAAHCVQADPSVFTVVAGEHDLRVEEGQEQRVKVDKIIVHPNYNS